MTPKRMCVLLRWSLATSVALPLGCISALGDRDGDGLAGSRDVCPDVAEDMDGFEDDDGCPDGDNDRDGVRDEDDRCPNHAEDRDGDFDDDGCPEGERVPSIAR